MDYFIAMLCGPYTIDVLLADIKGISFFEE